MGPWESAKVENYNGDGGIRELLSVKSRDQREQCSPPRTRLELIAPRGSDVTHGIHLFAVVQHFEMHMRTGGTTGRTHFGDDLTFFHSIADSDIDFIVMAVAC